ncbi:AbiH family protein [Anaerosporobacter faecicola]|uniref:AbiH family protein n=1 Tax=Anaerosporobacter faecicola TaxID=2718714 RepID=UPI001439FCE8|nr:AbiH family protein [Anaerosporobacter faecicola]
MTILVLGNGFDLAHGLPTTYKNFLDFMCVVRKIGKHKDNASKVKCIQRFTDRLCETLKNQLNQPNEDTVQCIEEYRDCLRDELVKNFCDSRTEQDIMERNRFLLENAKNNTWIAYFIQVPMYEKENWIDFESEISHVIQSVDADMSGNEEKEVETLTNVFLRNRFTNDNPDHAWTLDHGDYSGTLKKKITFSKLIYMLYDDLNRLTRCLEIYLANYVQKLESSIQSPDILGIKPNKILTFNYTDTYKKIYEHGKVEYDYIHGKAELTHTLQTNNMVLGIDEYLPEERKNSDIAFITFKKYYQRIRKRTGNKYRNWVGTIRKRYEEEIERSNREQDHGLGFRVPVSAFTQQHYLYIFGHSLDLTDGDIIRDLLLNDNVKTVIYYCNDEIFGRQIANLVKVIGQDELIRRTGGPTKTITFQPQKAMKKRLPSCESGSLPREEL